MLPCSCIYVFVQRAPAMGLAMTSCVVFRYLGVPPGPQDCILYARGTRPHRNRWMTVTVAAQSHLGNHSGLRVAICPRQTNVCFVRCSSHAHAMLLHGHSTLFAGHDVVSFTRVLNLELLCEDEDPGHLVHIRHIK